MTLNVPTENDWPRTLQDEARIAIARCYARDQLKEIGEKFPIEWFDENDVTYESESKARQAIAETIGEPADLQAIVDSVYPDPQVFQQYRGYHLAGDFESNQPTIKAGPPKDEWEEIARATRELVSDSPELAAQFRDHLKNRITSLRFSYKCIALEVLKAESARTHPS